MSRPVLWGVALGSGIAFAQATLSVWCLKRSLNGAAFYRVWAGGILARLAIFGITAGVVSDWPRVNLAATLLTLALGTMIFIVVEVKLIFRTKGNGFSRGS